MTQPPQTPASATAAQPVAPAPAGSSASASADRGKALHLYREMLRIRTFEERLQQLVGDGRIGGTTHLYAGQEAIAVGVSSHLRTTDLVVSTHRGHGHLLAKGARADRALAEFAGRSDGYCRGFGGSQHTAVPAIGHMGSNGITGGGLPIAVGLALAGVQRGVDQVVVAYLGDGAAATGNFHESCNLAALWRLPVVFVVENNGYAMSTPVAVSAACESFADWGARYRGMATARVDGNDVLAVAAAAAPLLARARAGGGPALLECRTWRLFGHSKSDANAYRDAAEDRAWRARDPLLVLAAAADLPAADCDRVAAEVAREIDEATTFALASPPAPADEARTLHDDLTVPADAAPCRIATGAQTTMTEALRETLRGELERDPAVIVLGEDLGAYGGAFGVTRGLLQQFGPTRIRETPISENGFTGAAVGAAVGGLRPVVELMFSDFVTCCMDALVNHAAKLRYMYARQVRVPMCLRMPIGRRHGYGATHSQSLESWFLHVPGLRVLCPATVADAVGLLRTAIRSDVPVLFLEPKLLYPARGAMPAPDHVVPFGSARIDREGDAISLFTYGQCVPLAQQAADRLAEHGHRAEIVDLRSLSPLDLATCEASLRKTGRGICVHEATAQGGVGAALTAALLPLVFGWLHAPIEIVAGAHVPMPSSPDLEAAVMPSPQQVVDTALRLLDDY